MAAKKPRRFELDITLLRYRSDAVLDCSLKLIDALTARRAESLECELERQPTGGLIRGFWPTGLRHAFHDFWGEDWYGHYGAHDEFTSLIVGTTVVTARLNGDLQGYLRRAADICRGRVGVGDRRLAVQGVVNPKPRLTVSLGNVGGASNSPAGQYGLAELTSILSAAGLDSILVTRVHEPGQDGVQKIDMSFPHEQFGDGQETVTFLVTPASEGAQKE
ncbi:MAG: hypothetical protein PHT12_03195 [Patescibacteria group bacterium]|nr:hypothetical protein [Patescibacteria group bacterium]